jgi:hypothetical protein
MMKYDKVLHKINKEMTAKGYSLDYVTDGEDRFYAKDHSKTELYENALACDIGTMAYQDNAGNRIAFYLVYGNLDYETISDAGWNSPKAEADSEAVFEAIYKAYDPDYCNI